jgi:formyl-CoA transferase
LKIENSISESSLDALTSAAASAGLTAARVNNVNEVLNHPQVIDRELVLDAVASDGVRWPLLNSPLRLSRTAPVVQRPIGRLGEGNDDILKPLEAARIARDQAIAS